MGEESGTGGDGGCGSGGGGVCVAPADLIRTPHWMRSCGPAGSRRCYMSHDHCHDRGATLVIS